LASIMPNDLRSRRPDIAGVHLVVTGVDVAADQSAQLARHSWLDAKHQG